MATHTSAIKEQKQSLVRRDRNRHKRARLRTAIKRFRKAVEAGDVELAKSLLPATLSLLDRTARCRAIHPNSADRTKSRLTVSLNRMSSAS